MFCGIKYAFIRLYNEQSRSLMTSLQPKLQVCRAKAPLCTPHESFLEGFISIRFVSYVAINV
jgi:hypothetical protein